MAALRLLAVHAYCLRRRALPSTFFRPAWPEKPRLATWVVTFCRFSHEAGKLHGPQANGGFRPAADIVPSQKLPFNVELRQCPYRGSPAVANS